LSPQNYEKTINLPSFLPAFLSDGHQTTTQRRLLKPQPGRITAARFFAADNLELTKILFFAAELFVAISK